MIKTIILLVIVFYTFPCQKINAQSRDTSNIFAGYYIAVYNKSDLSHKKIRRHHKHSYNTAIDSRYRTYFIPIKIGKNNINQENIWKEVTDNKKESDTIFIFPDSTDIKLFKQIGLIDSNISDKKHLLLQEIKSLPYYNTASNKAYLFKCLYVKGTFLQLRIDTIDKNWQDYLLDIYSISTKKKKKLLLVTGIDSLHSIKSDGTSIQARLYIKTGQQKPCTALIVGNWFAGEEGYIRKEALLEQGEPFVSWIRCNDCPQIRFNESDSGSVVYPGPPVSWNDPSNPDDPQAGYGYIPNDTTKEETFFYHSDHLGSTSYITDDKANITQYDAYLPYGELLVDEHSSSEDLPYKFNGKEMDEETGLYYYGARYINPMASIWYGVDPLAEKYKEIGSYVYCADNPINLFDPDGQKFIYNAQGKFLRKEGKDNLVYIERDGKLTQLIDHGNGMTDEQFNIAAHIVDVESSDAPNESLWIAHAANNAVDDKDVNYAHVRVKGGPRVKNHSLYEQLNDQNYSTTPASARVAYDKDYLTSSTRTTARAGIIDALQSDIDPTHGATLWDGTDFATKGLSHPKFRQYNKITIPDNIRKDYVYRNESYLQRIKSKMRVSPVFERNGIFIHDGKSTAKFSLIATGSFGRTIFWHKK